ncbi:sigma-54-dependent Fis family transcriptional regulator, partial [Bacteroides nordii]|nr:sigma-54-dependent Fis family transcriptional regulator [Bacteroides nordii]
NRILAESFVRSLSEKLSHPVTGISPAYLAELCQQMWKGNILELRNVIESSLIVCDGECLDVCDLQLEIQNCHY